MLSLLAVRSAGGSRACIETTSLPRSRPRERRALERPSSALVNSLPRRADLGLADDVRFREGRTPASRGSDSRRDLHGGEGAARCRAAARSSSSEQDRDERPRALAPRASGKLLRRTATWKTRARGATGRPRSRKRAVAAFTSGAREEAGETSHASTWLVLTLLRSDGGRARCNRKAPTSAVRPAEGEGPALPEEGYSASAC